MKSYEFSDEAEEELQHAFTIVYLDDPDMIRVVAFAHTKRRHG